MPLRTHLTPRPNRPPRRTLPGLLKLRHWPLPPRQPLLHRPRRTLVPVLAFLAVRQRRRRAGRRIANRAHRLNHPRNRIPAVNKIPRGPSHHLTASLVRRVYADSLYRTVRHPSEQNRSPNRLPSEPAPRAVSTPRNPPKPPNPACPLPIYISKTWHNHPHPTPTIEIAPKHPANPHPDSLPESGQDR